VLLLVLVFCVFLLRLFSFCVLCHIFPESLNCTFLIVLSLRFSLTFIKRRLQYGCLESFPFRHVKIFLFSSAKPRDFDGMLGTGLPVSMYTTKTPIDKCHFNVTQLKDFFTFSVKDRYQLNYCICIKDVHAQTTTLK
jgi:hypothetical protein